MKAEELSLFQTNVKVGEKEKDCVLKASNDPVLKIIKKERLWP